MAPVKSSSKKTGPVIYVIATKQDSLLNAELDRLLDELLEPSQRATGLFAADGASAVACDVLDELRTPALLSEKKVVVVRDADNFISKNRQHLERYFDNPSAKSILVLTVNNWSANTKLAKKLPGKGKLISVTQPKRWQLPERLIRYAQEAHNKKLQGQAAELLVESAGDDLPGLYGEIDKLAIFVDNEKTITTEHVEALTGHNRLFNSFAVIESCLAGDVGKAINRLRDMFANDKSAEYTFVGAFAYHFRRLFGAKRLLEEGLGPSEITKRLRIWGNTEGFFAQLRKISLGQIAENLRQLAEMDYAIKTGRAKPQVAAEQLVLKLSGSLESVS